MGGSYYSRLKGIANTPECASITAHRLSLSHSLAFALYIYYSEAAMVPSQVGCVVVVTTAVTEFSLVSLDKLLPIT